MDTSILAALRLAYVTNAAVPYTTCRLLQLSALAVVRLIREVAPVVLLIMTAMGVLVGWLRHVRDEQGRGEYRKEKGIMEGTASNWDRTMSG